MTTFEQVALVVTGAVIAILAVVFGGSEIGESAVLGYLTVVGGYLGLSLAKTVTESASKPKGEFADGKRWKYYVCMGLVAAVFLASLLSGVDIGLGGPAVVAAFFVIMGSLVSMIQANKIATLKDGTG